MTDRIIDISEIAVRLRVDLGRLAIEVPDRDPVFVPMREIAAIVISNQAVSMSQSVLSELAAAGGILVAMSSSFHPAAMLLPLEGHSTQTARIVRQTAVSEPTKKRAWQAIVRAKIRAQWALLAETGSPLPGADDLVAKVHSGDPDNLEAQAAARYWRALFGDAFRRDREAFDQNRLLNYGYAVLRAATARAICAAGLHPSIGVKHHNQYNPFCLADDLMEPYRPLVDRVVHRVTVRDGAQAELDQGIRAELVGSILGRYRSHGTERTLFDLLARSASSLARVMTGDDRDLELWVPE